MAVKKNSTTKNPPDWNFYKPKQIESEMWVETKFNTGGEGHSGWRARRAKKKLIEFRGLLEKGDITVEQFLNIATPLTDYFVQQVRALSGQGSNRANAARNINEGQTLRDVGFALDADNRTLKPDLGPKYEEEVREHLLPPDVTGDERKKIIEDIPSDTPIGSDQFEIEREGIREKGQAVIEQETAEKGRADRLRDLSDLLVENEQRQFQTDIPGMQERLQASGQLTTSAFPAELARQRGLLAGQTQFELGRVGISDRDLAIQGQLDVGSDQRAFQQAAMQRQFGMADQAANFQQQLQIAQLTQPNTGGGGKSKGEKAMNIVQSIGTLMPGASGAAMSMAGNLGQQAVQRRDLKKNPNLYGV